jgi:hypothetical protein
MNNAIVDAVNVIDQIHSESAGLDQVTQLALSLNTMKCAFTKSDTLMQAVKW